MNTSEWTNKLYLLWLSYKLYFLIVVISIGNKKNYLVRIM